MAAHARTAERVPISVAYPQSRHLSAKLRLFVEWVSELIRHDPLFQPPTILTDITRDNPVFGEEFFGPVARVYAVDSEDEAVEIANATEFGLGGSVHGADEDRCRKIAERIESGMVMIHSANVTIPETPFGGIKKSGFGRELSKLGIGEFINHKLIRSFPPA